MFCGRLGAIHKGRPADPGGLKNPVVQLLFECDSIVLSGRRVGRGGLEILVLAGRPL